MASDKELADFLAGVERRAFKHVAYAVRDDDAALDVVQDAMIKLAEKYGDRPTAELPLLFQRILQNATNDFFRRQKVRNTWVSLFSSLGNGDDDEFDMLETYEAAENTAATENSADRLEREQVLALIDEEIQKLPARQREAFLMQIEFVLKRGPTAARDDRATGCRTAYRARKQEARHPVAAGIRAVAGRRRRRRDANAERRLAQAWPLQPRGARLAAARARVRARRDPLLGKPATTGRHRQHRCSRAQRCAAAVRLPGSRLLRVPVARALIRNQEQCGVSNKRGLAVFYAGVIAALVALAATYPRFHPRSSATAVSSNAAAPASAAAIAPGGASVADIAADALNPLSWGRLTAAQRNALAPLASEWDRFSDERKRRWMKIASRYPKVRAEEQERLHRRMAEWVRMTPEQRRVAREHYQLSKKLSAQAREQAWAAYQQLPDELKRKLSTAGKSRRPTVVSAPPSGKHEIKDLRKLERTNGQATLPRAGSATAAAAPGASSSASAPPCATATAPASAAGLRSEPEKPAQSVPWFFNDHAQ
ncbi:hypothetical protein DFQ28_002476 [Apophysomyces sp. BC1034]|nr:hypothetical protein DFQ28_002476 [Apophysomyces sp. BC1034]